MSDLHSGSRSDRLDRAIHALLAQTPEIEAAAVVSFDGLPMAAALPPSMDEDRVAAMSAALLSLGERAAQGLGRGELSQVYIEGDSGTVFLVSCDDEAVLVAVASKGAKVGMMLYEVRRTAAAVAEVLRAEDEVVAPAAPTAVPAQPEPVAEALPPAPAAAPAEPVYAAPTYTTPTYATQADSTWSSYAPTGSTVPGSVMPPSTWS
jgi:predicted regulator of Ras-like GTPase activity (Roadblock/LC7/MglB family)